MKTPPQALESELYTLGSMVRESETIDEVRPILQPEEFYRDSHEIMARILFTLRDRGKAIDEVIIMDALEATKKFDRNGAFELVADCLHHAPHTVNVRHHASKVHDRAQLRSIIAAAQETAQEAYDVPADELGTDVIARAESRFLAIGEGRATETIKPLATVVRGAMNAIDGRRKGEVFGVPTGLSDLDDLIGSCIPNGGLCVIAGRPGMGKSSLGLNIAEHVAIDCETPTLLFSLEMGDDEIGERLLSGRARIDGRRLKQTTPLTGKEANQLIVAQESMGDRPLKLVDIGGLSFARIASMIRRAKAAMGIQLVIIDYVNLIAGTGGNDGGKPRHEIVGMISQSAKNLARELGIPIILLAQLNRNLENRPDKRPILADLKESGKLEEDADMVFLLHRPEVYDKNDEPGIAECIVAKNRSGATGVVKLAYIKPWTRFESLTRRQEPSLGNQPDWTKN